MRWTATWQGTQRLCELCQPASETRCWTGGTAVLAAGLQEQGVQSELGAQGTAAARLRLQVLSAQWMSCFCHLCT